MKFILRVKYLAICDKLLKKCTYIQYHQYTNHIYTKKENKGDLKKKFKGDYNQLLKMGLWLYIGSAQ